MELTFPVDKHGRHDVKVRWLQHLMLLESVSESMCSALFLMLFFCNNIQLSHKEKSIKAEHTLQDRSSLPCVQFKDTVSCFLSCCQCFGANLTQLFANSVCQLQDHVPHRLVMIMKFLSYIHTQTCFLFLCSAFKPLTKVSVHVN